MLVHKAQKLGRMHIGSFAETICIAKKTRKAETKTVCMCQTSRKLNDFKDSNGPNKLKPLL